MNFMSASVHYEQLQVNYGLLAVLLYHLNGRICCKWHNGIYISGCNAQPEIRNGESASAVWIEMQPDCKALTHRLHNTSYIKHSALHMQRTQAGKAGGQANIWCNLLFPFSVQPKNHKSIMGQCVCVCVLYVPACALMCVAGYIALVKSF